MPHSKSFSWIIYISVIDKVQGRKSNFLYVPTMAFYFSRYNSVILAVLFWCCFLYIMKSDCTIIYLLGGKFSIQQRWYKYTNIKWAVTCLDIPILNSSITCRCYRPVYKQNHYSVLISNCEIRTLHMYMISMTHEFYFSMIDLERNEALEAITSSFSTTLLQRSHPP